MSFSDQICFFLFLLWIVNMFTFADKDNFFLNGSVWDF